MNDTQKKLDSLRQLRNKGSKVVSELKRSGKPFSKEIQELKELSLEIKKIEAELKQDVVVKTPRDIVENVYCRQKENIKVKSITAEKISFRLVESLEQLDLREIQNLEKDSNTFAQSLSSWILPWYEYGNQNYVPLVVEAKYNSQLIGIGFFYVRRYPFFTLVKSAPAHYGDFYNFIISSRVDRAFVEGRLIEHLKSYRHDVLIVDQVNSNSTLCKSLHSIASIEQKLTNIHTVYLKGRDEQTFLATLSPKMRASLRSKERKLTEKYDIEFSSSIDVELYKSLVAKFRKVTLSRRGQDIEEFKYQRRLSSILGIKDSRQFKFYYLSVDGDIAAFRLGFIHEGIYYEWKSGHKSELNSLSVGDIFTWMILKDHLKNGIVAHNFMAGDYTYKRRWAEPRLQSVNYRYITLSGSFLSKVFLFFYNHCYLGLKKVKASVIKTA